MSAQLLVMSDHNLAWSDIMSDQANRIIMHTKTPLFDFQVLVQVQYTYIFTSLISSPPLCYKNCIVSKNERVKVDKGAVFHSQVYVLLKKLDVKNKQFYCTNTAESRNYAPPFCAC